MVGFQKLILNTLHKNSCQSLSKNVKDKTFCDADLFNDTIFFVLVPNNQL